MRSAHTDKHYAQFWASPAGSAILSWEQTVLDHMAQQVFGFHAVSFHLASLNAFKASTVHHPLIVLQNEPHSRLTDTAQSVHGAQHEAQHATQLITPHVTQMVMNHADWPIQDASLDYIVLPHVLEFAEDPHAVLREAARCLRPGAYLTLTCFNPRSVLGLQSAGAGLGGTQQWLSRRRLIDWMQLLGLQVDKGAVGHWRPLGLNQKRFDQTAWLDTLGERWWPQMANVFALRVVKRSLPDVRQFKPKNKTAFARSGRVIGTVRSNPHNRSQHVAQDTETV